jgi:hypothetical protein
MLKKKKGSNGIESEKWEHNTYEKKIMSRNHLGGGPVVKAWVKRFAPSVISGYFNLF